MATKVAILGGGVAGLTAAHELTRCGGFTVEVYERENTSGGKAKSNVKPNSGVGGLKDLPGEHGFRFFPGFYRHVPDTMSRIPFQGNPNGVLDNLVSAPLGGIAQDYKPLYTFPIRSTTGASCSRAGSRDRNSASSRGRRRISSPASSSS
jgi:15-cis-phytoene desaturase